MTPTSESSTGLLVLTVRILLAHNRYQAEGGEDAVFQAELDLLRHHGHQVVTYEARSSSIKGLRKLRVGLNSIWSRQSMARLRTLLTTTRPQIAHFTNIFPLISPSAYYACQEMGVPVVQTAHNYRLLCPTATFLRAGSICEDCVEHSLLQSIRYSCYRGSRLGTAAVAAMLAIHRFLGTWSTQIDAIIAPSDFAARKLAACGIDEAKLRVKPNFIPQDPGPRYRTENSALFVGRLAPEKGLDTLLQAWQQTPNLIPLEIVGDGPLHAELVIRASKIPHVRIRGALPHPAVLDLMKRTRFLVFPSHWYEVMPLTILEAYACGLPVISSRLGAMKSLVIDGHTGLHFEPGSIPDLVRAASWASTHPSELARMGSHARKTYEDEYGPERNYDLLMAIYSEVLARKQCSVTGHASASGPGSPCNSDPSPQENTFER